MYVLMSIGMLYFIVFAFEKYEDKIMQWSDKIKNNLYLCIYSLAFTHITKNLVFS